MKKKDIFHFSYSKILLASYLFSGVWNMMAFTKNNLNTTI